MERVQVPDIMGGILTKDNKEKHTEENIWTVKDERDGRLEKAALRGAS
jgi:hypothetical protein